MTSPDARPLKSWSNLGLAVSLLTYLGFAFILGFNRPGLQYDEALFLRGSVQILRGATVPTYTHEARSGGRIGSKWLPLMDLPYAGAVKTYLMLIPYALFGTKAAVARAVAVILSAAGIAGVFVFLRDQFGNTIATASTFALSIHPALLDQTLYDNSVVAVWMASLGLICLAANHYLKARSIAGAFQVGVYAGLAVWCRANFLWLLGSAALAFLIARRPRWNTWRRRDIAFFCGGLTAGSVPVILYELLSRFGTLRYMKAAATSTGAAKSLPERLRMLSEALISDGEHRLIWGGPSGLPAWQPIFVSALLAGALLMCLFGRGSRPAWNLGIALTVIFFGGIMCLSRLAISEHHLVTLVPLAAVAVSLGLRDLRLRVPASGPLIWGVAVIYLALAVYWNLAAAHGIRRSGGRDNWSDEIEQVTRYLEREPGSDHLKVLDWGFSNSIFVLSNGRVEPADFFWGATETLSPTGLSWSEEIKGGGVYLLAPEHRGNFPAAGSGFRRAVAVSGQTVTKTTFNQKLGDPYCDVFRLQPASANRATNQRRRSEYQ